MIQIRDSEKYAEEEAGEESTLMDQIFDPIGGTYNSVSNSKEVMNDDYLSFTEGWYDGEITYASVEYYKDVADSTGVQASLSWRLTPKEIESIDHTLTLPDNHQAFQEIASFFEE